MVNSQYNGWRFETSGSTSNGYRVGASDPRGTLHRPRSLQCHKMLERSLVIARLAVILVVVDRQLNRSNHVRGGRTLGTGSPPEIIAGLRCDGVNRHCTVAIDGPVKLRNPVVKVGTG
jgi:hypothetical protein